MEILWRQKLGYGKAFHLFDVNDCSQGNRYDVLTLSHFSTDNTSDKILC